MNQPAFTSNAMALSAWGKAVGITRPTWYRLMRKGFLVLAGGPGGKPMNINGRLFITKEDDAKFWDRASKGEFAKELAGVAKKVA